MNRALLAAINEFVRRHGEVWRHAWQQRHQMTPPRRLPHELQFLPAALALQETPVSPAPRVAMWLLIGFMLIALLWAIVGRIDIVATAQGRIVPGGRTKTIQSLQTASVKRIHVSDGQAVSAGDLLVELDPTVAHADARRLAVELEAARLAAARSRAMLAVLEGRSDAPDPRPADIDESAWQASQRLLASQLGEFRARVARIEAEVIRRQASLAATGALVDKLEQTLPIARQRAMDLKDLAERKFVSRHGYLEREQVRIEHEGDLANLSARRREIEASLREADSQKTEVVAQVRRATLDTLNRALQQQASLEQELAKADLQGRLTLLRAPVAGTVQQLAIHTESGVVTPAQPLMMIVPRDQLLEVEAFLENKDIGFIRTGQQAEVKVESFPFTKFGTIAATVSSVSHDAISDEKRGLVYSTRVQLQRHTVQVDGAAVALSPGMAVAVEIKTGRRRVIEYFLSPLIAYANESLRER